MLVNSTDSQSIQEMSVVRVPDSNESCQISLQGQHENTFCL